MSNPSGNVSPPRVVISPPTRTAGKPPLVQRFFRRSTYFAVLLMSLVTGALTGLLLVQRTGASTEAQQVKALADFQPSVVTQVFAADGKTVIGEFALERRIPLNYNEIPPNMRNAILAIEDARFEKHWGVDPIGIARATFRNLLAGRAVEGGSTLTQQLTKILFLTPEKTFTRKIREQLLALEIERRYSKQQIMELYCNQIFLGGGAYGVEAGAQYYFGKPVKDLSVEECAVLAAIPKAPTTYSPVLNKEKSLERRNLVLQNMIEEGFISREDGEAAKKRPIKLNLSNREINNSGPYAYFVEEVRRQLENNEEIGTKKTHTGGLRVITTIDAAAQVRAVNAVRAGLHAYAKRHRSWQGKTQNVLDLGVKDLARYKHPDWDLDYFEGMYLHGLVTEVLGGTAKLSFGKYRATLPTRSGGGEEGTSPALKVGDIPIVRIKKMNAASSQPAPAEAGKKKKTEISTGDPFELQVELDQLPAVAGALMCLDAHTGEVKAMVGGYDFSISKFNNATQANRQTGSCFKPFIYTAALENGWKPDDPVADAPFTSGNWSPKNYDGGYMGTIPLRTALAQSRNIPAVRLLASVGIRKGADMVKRFGITNPMAPYLPSALGATEVPLVEMVAAYSTFPNAGKRVIPHCIHRIEDRLGRVLYDADTDETLKPAKVVSPYVASQMVSLMRGVVEGGTAAAIKSVTEGDLNKRAIGGKTGTVNDFTDAWFIGYTPSYVCGAWIGYQGEKRTLGKGETGGVAALPMWTRFMGYFMKGKPNDKFPDADIDDAIKKMQAMRAKEIQKQLETEGADVAAEEGADAAKQALRGEDGEDAPKKKPSDKPEPEKKKPDGDTLADSGAARAKELKKRPPSDPGPITDIKPPKVKKPTR